MGFGRCQAHPKNSTPRGTAGAYCTAGFRAGQCPLWVISVGPKQAAASPDVRFAPKADKYADISLSPLCAISQHDRALLLPRRRGEPCRWDPETYALALWSPHA